MPRFEQQGYCEFCSAAGSPGCSICNRWPIETLMLDLGLYLLMDACAELDSSTIYWLAENR